MAASRSMLESLLARVRQRATEPRGAQPAAPRQALDSPPAPRVAVVAPPVAGSVAAAPVAAAPVAAPEEEIEEYDDELIEILDDDVAAESEPQPPSTPASAPLELRASAPSVEMRRRAVPPSSRPNQLVVPRAVAPAAAPAPVAPAPVSAAAALRAEVVARRPVPAGAVVQAQAARPAQRSSFLELLDASLDLGK